MNGHFPQLNVTVDRLSGKNDPFRENLSALQEYESFVLAANNEPNPIFAYYSSHRKIDLSTAKLTTQGNKPDSLDPYAHIPNASANYQNILKWFDGINNLEARTVRDTRNISFRLPELESLRKAVASLLLEEYEKSNFEFDTNEMTLLKKGSDIPIPVSQLSQGFQSIFLLSMDLLSRMISANRQMDYASDNVLHIPGIVLIDDVDLHLLLTWQQKIMTILLDVFPKLQFIVTTYSPLILTTIKPNHIISIDAQGASPIQSKTYGCSNASVAREIFNVNPRPDNEVFRKHEDYLELVNDELVESAEALDIRKKLDDWIGDDDILRKTDMLIKNQKFRRQLKDAQIKQTS